MSSFSNPNILRLGHRLNWKHNLIKYSRSSWQVFLFNLKLFENVLAKYNFIVLRYFYAQEFNHFYFLVYKATSHRIFKKQQRKRRKQRKRIRYSKDPRALSLLPDLQVFIQKYCEYLTSFSYNHTPLLNQTFLYLSFFSFFSQKLELIADTTSQYALTNVLVRTITNFSKLRRMNSYIVAKIFHIHYSLRVELTIYQYLFVYYYKYAFLQHFYNFLVNFSNLRIWQKFHNTFLQIVSLYQHSSSLCSQLNRIKIISFYTRRKVVIHPNYLWKYKLYTGLLPITQGAGAMDFSIFFWNKTFFDSVAGGGSVPTHLIHFLHKNYWSVDFKKQRKFFFFKDTFYLLFLSVFFINPQLLSKHLSRLFMLVRRHFDIFNVFNWLLSSPVVTPWLADRLCALHIVVKGRIAGNSRAVVKNFGFGRIPRQTYDLYLLFSFSAARTWYGSYGIKIWFWYNEKAIWASS